MVPHLRVHTVFALIYLIIHDAFSLFLDNSLKLSSVTNVKTTQLLNQLCNESQDEESMNRDACYGCFFRASSHQFGYPLLLSMSNCANNYLNNTEYGHCAEYLKNATLSINSNSNPALIYCSFLECVRQVNKDKLSALIEKPKNHGIGKRLTSTSVYHKSVRKNFDIFARNSMSGSLRRPICIIKEDNFENNTVRPGTEPVDPRVMRYYRLLK